MSEIAGRAAAIVAVTRFWTADEGSETPVWVGGRFAAAHPHLAVTTQDRARALPGSASPTA